MATDKATLATATTKSENTKDAASTSNNNKNNKRPREEDSTPPASDIKSLLMPSLFRLTEGIPRRELKLMISESKACEALLEKEIKELQESLKNKSNNNNSSKKSQVDIYLETEVTPPDRYFTVSSLLGRLRDDLATPLPPNSILPALRAQHGLLQQPPKKKKSLSNQSNNNDPLDVGSATSPEEPTDIEKQKRVLALLSNPEYTQEHPTPAALLTCWKKISTHRTSVVFRRPVNPKEAPGYTDRIFFPMDLSLVRKMIVARLIKSFSELHQRIGLICHNCVKYNGRESDYGIVTRDFEATVDECVVAAVAAAGEKNVPPAPTPKNNPSETKQQGDKTATKSPVAAGAAAPVTNTKADIADTKAAAATTTKAVPNATAAASDKNAKKEPESATLAAKSPIPNANAKPAKKGNNSSNSKKSAGK